MNHRGGSQAGDVFGEQVAGEAWGTPGRHISARLVQGTTTPGACVTGWQPDPCHANAVIWQQCWPRPRRRSLRFLGCLSVRANSQMRALGSLPASNWAQDDDRTRKRSGHCRLASPGSMTQQNGDDRLSDRGFHIAFHDSLAPRGREACSLQGLVGGGPPSPNRSSVI